MPRPEGGPAAAYRSEADIARQIRARSLVAGLPPEQIAAAIAAECGCSTTRAYRLALGMTLADVVAQVRARFEADGRPVPRFSEALLSAYESGHKRPGPEYLHYLCATYQADPADLGVGGWCLCGRSHRANRAARPVALVAAASDTDEDADEMRAMLLRQMRDPGSRVDGGFLGAVDRIRRRMDDALLGGTVSAALIERLERSAAGYGRQYMAVPPLRLLCDVLLDFAEVRCMCAERQPLEFSERLYRLASQLAGLAGITMLDLGDHRLARAFFRTARTAADETGDRQLRAWVTVREALVPLYFGDPAEALTLAGAAGDLAGRRLCAAAVMAPVTEARARARMADADVRPRRDQLARARATLDQAHDALPDLPGDQRADAAFGYTERQLSFHSGDILAGLGDWQGAYRAYGQAGQLYAATEVLDCALVAFGQARCVLESAEPKEALTMGQGILAGLPPEHQAQVVLQAAKALGEAAAARDPRLPALADYREALRGA